MSLARGILLEVQQIRRDGWDDTAYPFALPAVRSWSTLTLHPSVTFLVGENGSGKSTLIEAFALAAGFGPEGGSKDHRFATHDTHSGLHQHIRLVRGARRETGGFFLRAESFYTQTSHIDRVGNPLRSGGRRLLDRSHGEGVMALVKHRFDPGGLFIMDEPEAALSPSRQMALLSEIRRLVDAGSQFIIATHSPIMMAYPDSLIYQIDDAGPLPCAWENVPHVDTLRQFLKYPDRFLDILLEEE